MIMGNRIVKGLILMVITSVIDLSNFGLSKEITSFNDFFPLTYKQAIYYAIVLSVYLYGFYLFTSGIVLAIKKKKR